MPGPRSPARTGRPPRTSRAELLAAQRVIDREGWQQLTIRRLDRPGYRAEALTRLDPAAFPQLTRLAPRWESLTARDTYAYGLGVLVDGSLPRDTGPAHVAHDHEEPDDE
jgi:hypothetical protein